MFRQYKRRWRASTLCVNGKYLRDQILARFSESDRLAVDPARRQPATGEMFVLWDGGRLVVKRVEYVNSGPAFQAGDNGDPPALRLKSANPHYTSLADEVHIVGRGTVDRQAGITGARRSPAILA